MKLRRYIETIPLADLTLLARNARYMTHEQYQRLVANIKADGALTSVPLVYPHRGRAEYDELPDGTLEVLSGNHRVQAGIDAGIEASECMVIDEPIPAQRRTSIQLSHNAINGQDDLAVLRELYDDLDLDAREYSGLDDKTLELMGQVDISSLSEAALDFHAVTLTFLPDELDRAREALASADEVARGDSRWLAALGQYDQVLDALESVQGAYQVTSTVAAFGVLLGVFEAHLDELRAGWYDDTAAVAKHNGHVPLETVFGTRTVPADVAAVLAQALNKLADRGDHRWQALERWAADTLTDRQ